MRAAGSIRRLVAAVLAAALISGALVVFPVRDLAQVLVEWVRDAGAVGVAVYAAAYIAATVLLVPGTVLTLGAGMVYGPVFGTLLVSPVSVAAATTAFVLGRTVARKWVNERIGGHPRFAAVDAAIEHEGLQIVLLLRLSPLFPFNLLNYALGLTRVRLEHFVLGSFLGMLPGTILRVYIGSLAATAASLDAGHPTNTLQQALYWIGLGATIAATVVITRMARRYLRAIVDDGGTPAATEVRA
ncbi:MAG: TVP38/TMEM64 family protein [Vicinamibacterales bacterium]